MKSISIKGFCVVALVSLFSAACGLQDVAHDGMDGDDGQNGRDGQSGQDGQDGIDGVDGADGKDGAVGPQGPKGDPGQDGEDGQDADPAPTTTPTTTVTVEVPVEVPVEETMPDPFVSPAACVLDFSKRYVSGATTGEVRGDLPLMTWENGLDLGDDNDDGYMGMTWLSEMPAGTYEFSYVGDQNANENEAWAQYGLPEDIARMSETGRVYLLCNWYDAAANEMVEVSNPHCNIRATVDEDCNFSPAGNMADFAISE